MKYFVYRFEKAYISKLLNLKMTNNENVCWKYPGYKMKSGYCSAKIGTNNGKEIRKLVHRLSYEYFVDKIPVGLVIDHLCRVRNCVNPKHLRVCTQYENLLCGNTKIGQTHCAVGHKLPKPRRGFFRRCRPCNVLWQRKSRAKNPDRYRAYDHKKYVKNSRNNPKSIYYEPRSS